MALWISNGLSFIRTYLRGMEHRNILGSDVSISNDSTSRKIHSHENCFVQYYGTMDKRTLSADVVEKQ